MPLTKVADRQVLTASGGISSISDTISFDFGLEGDFVITTVSNTTLTNTNFKGISFIKQETLNASLDDFYLNDVHFNIENVIDNNSFDIRANAGNNATGIYTIKYIITY